MFKLNTFLVFYRENKKNGPDMFKRIGEISYITEVLDNWVRVLSFNGGWWNENV